ncbi:MAG: hypothetical protein PWQ12_424 [Clostridiales bacterium]|jgi:predicted short-subunit dehydrogenase-like oxidoreductase (DUF2520 family)|nr:hypothetical protein [Clostridiales bacterium]
MKIGFVGAGAVGRALGIHFKEEVVGYYSRTPEHAREAAERIGATFYADFSDLIRDASLIMLTVNDDAIEAVAREIADRDLPLEGKVFAHTSGVHSSESLNALKAKGAKTMSLHPLHAFADPERPIGAIVFGIEGDITEAIKSWLVRYGFDPVEMATDQKIRYHLAAAVASNYLDATVDFAVRQLEIVGFSNEVARKALWPLILGTVENIEHLGTVKALTGPIARGDAGTIEKHLSQLSGEDREFYCVMGKWALKMASEKGLDDEKYVTLSNILKEA